MFESKSGGFLIAGLIFFAVPLLVMGVIPWTMYPDVPEKTIEQLAREGILHEFVELAERFPDRFERYFPAGVTYESYAEALTIGQAVYVAEACWHCHTQQVRSVSNESIRWGPVSRVKEYQNVLQRPALFGTRRIGPDLIRQGARHSNDWHVAHFFKPVNVSPTSVMPDYPWFYDDEGYPNKKGMGLITYIQWLGSWLPEYPYFRGGTSPFPSRKTVQPREGHGNQRVKHPANPLLGGPQGPGDRDTDNPAPAQTAEAI